MFTYSYKTIYLGITKILGDLSKIIETMQPVLIVFLYVSACILSISCRRYYYDPKCSENALKENYERTTCSHLEDEWGNVLEYNGYCRPFTFVIDKTISCREISADYLMTYRELVEDGPPYPLKLEVTESKIPVLPTSTFKNIKNVTVLVLENIKLKKITPGAFNFLERLKEVYLGQNELTAISDGIFNSLTTLEKVDLSRNRIETVTDDAFAGITLNNLNFSDNSISVLGEMLINSLSHLSAIDLSHNNLQNISSFNSLQIISLNLSHNSIESVDFEIFSKTRATVVDISFNKILEVTNFNLSNSYKIVLSHNRLDNFLTNDYKYVGSTRILDISYNNVETIDFLNVILLEFYVSFNSISSLNPDTFSGLYKLTHLYLDNNNLSSIPNSCFKDLTSLTHLNLSGNEITQLKFGTFDNLKQLQILDISNNNFKELPQYIFHSLNKLTHLLFQNNEISNINTDDLVDHMEKLVEIDLSNNTWSCQRLVNIVHKLKSRRISFPYGNAWEESNIYGIKCYETFNNSGVINISDYEVDLDRSKLNSFFNEDFTKTILYKYFNQDFKDSDFFKYLESLRKSSNSSFEQSISDNAVKKMLKEIKLNSKDIYGEFKNSEMYNYFNKDFKNSSFFKHLENFVYQTQNISMSEKLTISKLDEISNSFRNFSRELENILNVNNSPTIDFEKSNMYNYFNKDFKESNFFKYLESLNKMSVTEIHSENINDSRADQLVSPLKINEYPVFILYLNATFLMLILVVILFTAYRLIFRGNKYVLQRKEEVELI